MAEVTPPPSAAVASLKSIFPSLEDGVIASVLAQHDGNEDRAVESLLALTDDTFVSPERPGEDTLRAQAELDASYAKALALEEENAALAHQQSYRQQQQQQRTRSNQPPTSSSTPALDPNNLPYQPRVRKTQPSPYIHNPPVQNHNNSYDYHYGSDERRRNEQPQPGLEETFQKLAVQGQKLAVTGHAQFNTFLNSGFVSNLKDKVVNVATNIQQPARQNQNPNQGSSSWHSNPQYSQQPHQSTTTTKTTSTTYTPGSAPRTSNADFPADMWKLPEDDDASSSAANSINVYQPSSSSASPISSSTTPNQPIINRSSSPRTYVSPPSSTGKRSDEFLRRGERASPSLLGTSPSGGAPALSTSPSQAGKIDFAKLGLLPKQKISLDGKPSSSSPVAATTGGIARTGSPSSGPSEVVQKLEAQKKANANGASMTHKKETSSDDEDLGYTRNPFDE